MRAGLFTVVLACVGPLCVGALAGCGELRLADRDAEPDAQVDAATSSSDEDASDSDAGPTDAGAADAAEDATPPECVGPCPIEEIATDLFQATAITVDAKNVYFATESGDGTVYQCPKTGCAGAPIVLGSGYTFGIVVDGTNVIWGDFAAGKIWSCAIGGCGGTPDAVAQNETQARGVATDGASLFWSTGDGAVRACSASGACTPASRATGQGTVLGVAADQGSVFWGNYADDTVYACTGACASPRALGPGATHVSVHAGKVYWVNAANDTVVMCAAAGCNGKPLTVGSSMSPSHPVSDGDRVYWRDDLLNEILACPASGCAPGPVILAKDQPGQPGGQIAVDGTHVYWTTSSGVYRQRKN